VRASETWIIDALDWAIVYVYPQVMDELSTAVEAQLYGILRAFGPLPRPGARSVGIDRRLALIQPAVKISTE
jgi:hypothetical protein